MDYEKTCGCSNAFGMIIEGLSPQDMEGLAILPLVAVLMLHMHISIIISHISYDTITTVGIVGTRR